MTGMALLLFLVATLVHLTDVNYVIDELRDENSYALPPFSINRVIPSDGGLRLFIRTNSPDAVAALLAAGALEAQLSDHKSETVKPVSLSLGKAVWCSDDGNPSFLPYRAALPLCGGKPPTRIEYFFEVPVTLGPGRDLAIGQDPDFLWLIEERQGG
jgi:hypothetical protein